MGARDTCEIFHLIKDLVFEKTGKLLGQTNSEKHLYWPKVNLYYKDLNNPLQNLTVRRTLSYR